MWSDFGLTIVKFTVRVFAFKTFTIYYINDCENSAVLRIYCSTTVSIKGSGHDL